MSAWASCKRAVSKLSWRDVAVVAVRTLGVLLSLELAYLLVANGVLASSLIRKGVATADGMHLEYSSAWSWVPGRAHVRDLKLRIEDYNVQFEVGIGRGTLDVNLTELPFKKFHVLKLRADGVTFRMRHKVHEVGLDGPRLSAYPPIAGFADPPLYRGPPPPPIPDAQYDLWSVRIDDVVAHARELWILEYRFEGDAEARGSFMVRPARAVRVEPARMRLDAGSLTVGGAAVARQLRGTISCSIPQLDVQATEGLSVLQAISSNIELSLKGGDLNFLNAYAELRSDMRFEGAAAWSLRARVRRGVVERGTVLELLAPRAAIAYREWRLVGGMQMDLSREQSADRLRLDAHLRDWRARGRAACTAPPQLEDLRLGAAFKGIELFEPIEPASFQLAANGRASELSCLEELLPEHGARLGGAVELGVTLNRDGDGQGGGHVLAHLSNGSFDRGSVHLRSDCRAEARFRLDQSEQHQPFAQGAVSFKLTSAGSFLSLAIARPLRALVSGALGLDELDGTLAFHAEPKRVDLELTSARSGALTGRGFWRSRLGERRGAWLLSAAGVNLGIEQQGNAVHVAPLVPSSWLPETWKTMRGTARD